MGQRGTTIPFNRIGEIVRREGDSVIAISREQAAGLAAKDRQALEKYNELRDGSLGIVIKLEKARSAEEALEIISLVSALAPHLSFGIDPGELGKAGVAAIKYYQKQQRIAMGDEPAIDPNDAFGKAKKYRRPKDPIVLDLDSDGINSVGSTIADGVFFDHNGDGIKTDSGWIRPSDGFLVLDRNGNGIVDSGAELFGDNTPISGGTATNGFAALRSVDGNQDGVLDVNDTVWSDLRVWRDLNQDGISQSGELSSLTDLGIAAIGTAALPVSQGGGVQNLDNGNSITAAGQFTRSDGTTGNVAEFNLANNTFRTEFPTNASVDETAAQLPDVIGSGAVLNLRQAASLSTPEAQAIKGLLTQLGQATTRAAQLALTDQLLIEWANTSNIARSLDERVREHVYKVTGPVGVTQQYRFIVDYAAIGGAREANYIKSPLQLYADASAQGASGQGAPVSEVPRGTLDDLRVKDEYKDLVREWNNKIHILEAFNGQYFFELPQSKQEPFVPM